MNDVPANETQIYKMIAPDSGLPCELTTTPENLHIFLEQGYRPIEDTQPTEEVAADVATSTDKPASRRK